MRLVVQESPETRLANWATASAASSPEAEIASSVPPSAPSPRISRMLFAFARRPLACTSIVAANDAAARTNAPAGRACNATVSGSRTRVSSELGDTARLLRRSGHLRQGGAGRSRDARGDRAFDEGGVGQHDPLRLALAAGSGRLGVSELSDRLGLAKGTVHGLLRTLHDHGLVEQDADSDKYQLGPQLLQLSNRYFDLNELRARSLAWSELLATRAGEAVRVGVPHGNGVLVVHHVFRPDTSLQILEVGAMLPMHATALGQAVLAYLPEPERQDVLDAGLPKLTGKTVSTLPSLARELVALRERV